MVTEITTQQFQQKILDNKLPCVVDVYTIRCPNCKVIEPILEQTEKLNGAHYSFYKINATENMEIARKYKVLGVPTLLFFRHGKLVDKKTGVLQQEKIEKRLAKLVDYSEEEATKKEIKGYFKLP
jgi:thioredoxin 1